MRLFWKILAIIFISVYLAPVTFFNGSEAAPLLASYYLGTLPNDSASLQKLAKMDVLILSPDQFIVRKEMLDLIKKKNPGIKMLAYVPSQSYNFKYWPNDLVYKHLNGIKDEWWLRDSDGKVVSTWSGIKNLNMDQGWSEYLVKFINERIVALGNVDGIFFDMVDEGISGANNGDVVIGSVSGADESAANKEWIRRMSYLLSYAEKNIKSKYLVINGSSVEPYQQFVNGRMYETFPTPWEAGGNWSAIMTRLVRNSSLNKQPQMYIFNSNSNNTGKQNDYRKVRFGLASSLLQDNIYFGYDYGDQNHAQIWWYDEYDARLGSPNGKATSLGGGEQFQNDVWRRDFSNGLALVNSTGEAKIVDLGGEYEKLVGTQDKVVNDGSIVDRVTIPAKDGILLYKTFQTVSGVVYPNGSFLRFYKIDGSRARNGFFAFDNEQPGGAKVYSGDLNGDSTKESVVIIGPKMQIFDDKGGRWFNGFPLGSNYKGDLSVAIGILGKSGEKNIVVSGTKTGSVILYDYHGGVIKEGVYPLGKKYGGGFSVTTANLNGTPSILLSTNNGKPAEVLVYDKNLTKISKRFYPWGNKYSGNITIAAGDFNGEGVDEVAVAKQQKNPVVAVFSSALKKTNEFKITGIFGNQKIGLSAVSFLDEKKQELIVATSN